MKRLLFFILIISFCLIGCEPAKALPTRTITPAVETPASMQNSISATPTGTPPAIDIISNPIGAFAPGALPILQVIDMKSNTEGWAIGYLNNTSDDHILHTDDGSITLQDVTPPESAPPVSFRSATTYFQDAETAWVVYNFDVQGSSGRAPVVWRTTDAGRSWTPSAQLTLSDMMEFFEPGVLTFVDANHGWLLVHAGAGMMHDWVYLFATSDGGLTWTSLFDPTDSSLWMSCSKTGMAFSTATSGFVSGDCQGVAAGVYFYQTRDGGSTWAQVTLPDPPQNAGVFTNMDFACGAYNPTFIDAQHGAVLVSCQNFVTSAKFSWLYKTADGGTNWTPVNLPAAGGAYQFVDLQKGVYVAGKVYVTQDGGLTWKPVATVSWSGQPNFIDSNNGWIVALNGEESALVRTTDGGVTWSIIKPVVAP